MSESMVIGIKYIIAIISHISVDRIFAAMIILPVCTSSAIPIVERMVVSFSVIIS